MTDVLFVCALSILAGFIDSIAGGGGLITIPMWTLVLGPGAGVVATNKVGAFASSLMALLVYRRHGTLSWHQGRAFLPAIFAGAVLGSRLTALVPQLWFSYLLLALCPLILVVVWRKELLFAQRSFAEQSSLVLTGAGLLVGLYDGFFGPGGGTFMLLALLLLTAMPLFEALTLSKLANTLSAGGSLASFALQDLVDWRWGAVGGGSILVGAFVGARLTTRRSSGVVRPALAFVVTLLMLKLARDLWG